MAISIGQQFGSYEITALLGKGGMGEVYRARDTRLDRDVAIKTLPEEFEEDAERLARFAREAKLLASLNHANIAAIYGLEQYEGKHVLILELVEGETLADHLRRGPLAVDESLRLAAQIAEALQAAHEKGVIHRDLKPANIKITEDGTVKVLDFGLAKASGVDSSEADGLSNSPTLRTLASSPGMILGTAAYMSPEQAKGRPVDRRTDIFAFGCVLYDMLTGKSAFQGDDVSDTLAAVLRAEPDWNALPREISPALRTLIQGCLAKDRAKRIADISVTKFLLTEPSFAGSTSSQPRSRLRTALLIAAVVLVSIAAGGALVWKLGPPAPAAPVITFRIDLPEGQTFNGNTMPNVAISRDGTRIVYAANSRLYYRSISEVEAHAIAGTESTTDPSVVAAPAFSPDGRSIAFYSSYDRAATITGSIKTIPVEGGTAVTIGTVSRLFGGINWTIEGLVFADGDSGVVRLSPDGGKPERLVAGQNDETISGPQILPGGQSVLFTVGSSRNPDSWDQAKIVVQSLKTGVRKTLVDGGSNALYLPGGHLLYAVSGTIWAVPFDLRQQTVSGKGAPVIQGVRRNTYGASAVTQLAVSDTGTVLYIPGPAAAFGNSRSLVLTDRNGARKALPLPPGSYQHPRVSRDGKHAAVGVDDAGAAYISIYDLSTASPLRRLTFGGNNRFPVWSGDSQSVAFQSDHEGDLAIFMQRADGSSPTPERLTKPEQDVSHVPESWSSDGRTLLFSIKKDATFSLWMLSLPSKQAMPFGNVRSLAPIGATFSPDDRWVAYSWTDDQTPNRGSPNRGVYVQPFPPTRQVYQVPREYRDFHPAWGATTAELFYIPTVTRMSVVSVETKPTLRFGKPVNLPTPATRDRTSPNVRDYDVTPDGLSFLSSVPAGEEGASGTNPATQMRVVVNWLEELKQRVPVK
jgi:serine/threonine protein kinase